MKTNSRKILILMTIISLILLSGVLPAYAVYETDQYLILDRTLIPDTSEVEVGTYQDIKYGISGEEFTIDPDLIDDSYIAEKDIVLVLDVSGSMGQVLPGSSTRLQVLKESANRFIDKFDGTNTRISIVAYSNNANNLAALTYMKGPNSADHLKTFINGLQAYGTTNIGDGMRRAYWQLEAMPDRNDKYIVVMTDGIPNGYTTVSNSSQASFKTDEGNAVYFNNPGSLRSLQYGTAIAQMIAGEDITSFYIGLTNTFSSQLEQIAFSSDAVPASNGRHYYQVTTPDEVDSIFNNVISDNIISRLPLTVSFEESFPYGVEVVGTPSDFVTEVLPDGRYKVSGFINNLVLEKNDSTGKYSTTPWEGTIRVKYTGAGNKEYSGNSISYTDPFGNSKSAVLQNSLTVNVVDTTKPSAVENLRLDNNGGVSLDLSWDPSSDNVGVVGYRLYRDGSLVAETTSTSYTDTGLTQNTTYSYHVTAVDGSDNESDISNVLTVLTNDIEAPTAPYDLVLVSKNSTTISIAWKASTDNVEVAGYDVYRDGVRIAATSDTNFTDSGLTKGVTYTYKVKAFDPSGNESSYSNELSINTNSVPVADAGEDKTVEATSPQGASAVLDGSGSYDPDGDELTFSWTGSFGSADGKNPSVQMPFGTNTVTLSVYDGELTATDEVTICVVDTTPPTITGYTTTDSNVNGWYNSDVTVSFDAYDSGSGVEFVTPSITITTEGINQFAQGFAEDYYGNSVSTSVYGINIDKTAPVIGDIPVLSQTYKTTDSIVINYNALDSLSGVEEVTAHLNGVLTSNGERIDLEDYPGNNVLVVTAKDRAGNISTREFVFEVLVSAAVDLDPDTLNTKSKSDKNAFTAYIELPEGYDVSNIVLSDVILFVNGVSISAQSSPSSIKDRDGDGTLELMVKFDRQDVISAVGSISGDLAFELKGSLNSGYGFSGYDTVRIK